MSFSELGVITIGRTQYRVEVELSSGTVPADEAIKAQILDQVKNVATPILQDSRSGFVEGDTVTFSLDGRATFVHDPASSNPRKRREQRIKDDRILEIFRKFQLTTVTLTLP